jgi:hypothetical protein
MSVDEAQRHTDPSEEQSAAKSDGINAVSLFSYLSKPYSTVQATSYKNRLQHLISIICCYPSSIIMYLGSIRYAQTRPP